MSKKYLMMAFWLFVAGAILYYGGGVLAGTLRKAGSA